MSMPSHPSFEDLSAYHDGEAPEWAAHVGACGRCREQLDHLTALSAAVAQPVAPLAGAPVDGHPTADDQVGRALAALGPGAGEPGAGEPVPGAGRPAAAAAEPARPGPRWLTWATVASAAAVVLMVVGVVAVVTRSADDRPTMSATEGGVSSQPQPPGSGGQGLAADAVGPPGEASPGGDLGEVPDAATLLVRAQPGLAAARATASAPSPQGAPVAPAPRVVGTRPCETEARDRDASLGPVVYHATARRAGTPAVVLGFGPVGAPGPITVQMLAESDCRLLLSASSP